MLLLQRRESVPQLRRGRDRVTHALQGMSQHFAQLVLIFDQENAIHRAQSATEAGMPALRASSCMLSSFCLASSSFFCLASNWARYSRSCLAQSAWFLRALPASA